MKKSYDYFKKLKLLSDVIFEIYSKSILNKDFSSHRILFLAEKSELLNNLKNEFITPLERGDIFILAENLTAQLNSVYVLQGYLNLIKPNDLSHLTFFNSLFKEQADIFSRLYSFKSNIKLFEQCSQTAARLSAQKKSIEEQLINMLDVKGDQAIKAYAVCSAFLTLNADIYKTILQIERILIDNS